jgi:hypothetical protein
MPQISRSTQAIFVLMILTIGSSLGRARGTAPAADVLRFDAEWWQHANTDERRGFIYGYMDCRQPPKAANASIVDYQNAVSEMLKSQKASGPKAVTNAIERAWKTLGSRDIPGGEDYSEPHGYLDGEWWGGFEGPWPPNFKNADQGYLEGYLQCSSALVSERMVRRYQTAINHHYASGRHDRDKIADVLEPLLRSPVGSKKE